MKTKCLCYGITKKSGTIVTSVKDQKKKTIHQPTYMGLKTGKSLVMPRSKGEDELMPLKYSAFTYWEPCNFYGKYEIGEGTKVGAFCDIGGKVGKNCKIQAGVKIPPLVSIGDNVFIGADVVFTNDKRPPSDNLEETFVGYGAVIGANATILPGVTIGKGAVIGAGSLVSKSIPMGETWCGNPAHNIKHSPCKGCGKYGDQVSYCDNCLMLLN